MAKSTAIILARSGSKGLPSKNIRLCAGKPLMAWAIESALNAKTVGRVIVSTDSEEYAAIARQHGAETPFIRPAELAVDNAPTGLALVHGMKAVGLDLSAEDEIVVLMPPTSPLVSSADIDNTVDLLLSHPKANTVIGVSEAGPPSWFYRRDTEGYLTCAIKGGYQGENRQDQEVIYVIQAPRALRVHSQLKHPMLLGAPPWLSCLIPLEHTVDINYLADLEFAEWLLYKSGRASSTVTTKTKEPG